MSFSEVDQRYLELKQQSLAGTLTDEQFDEALHELMVQDAEGRWWAKSRETGEWHYYDAVSTNWVRAEPPAENAGKATIPPPARVQDQVVTPLPEAPAAHATSAAHPEPAESAPAIPDGSESLPRWAARTPHAAETPAPAPVSASEAAPVVRPRSAAAAGFGPIPELGTPLKVIFYLLSFFVPIVGLILYFVYRNKPAQQDRSAARTFLILGVVSLLLTCLCTVVSGSLAAWLIAVPST